MDSKYNFRAVAGERIAYVRQIAVSELPEDLRLKAPGIDMLYAVCDAGGARLALVNDRDRKSVV